MVQETVGDIGEDVKETKLGFYSAERDTAEERGRGGGQCEEGGEMEKEEKKLPTSFDLQQHSLFPTVPTSGKYATYKKTATTCSLQAPCDNSWGHTAVTTIP